MNGDEQQQLPIAAMATTSSWGGEGRGEGGGGREGGRGGREGREGGKGGREGREGRDDIAIHAQ